MPYSKTIVCLANSYKPPNGRCIAGREVLANGYGRWIRPVSGRETAEISLSESRCENDQSPKLLDIVAIPLLRWRPMQPQMENHLIDSSGRWSKKGRLSWHGLETLLDQPLSLWSNSDSTSDGVRDRITRAEAANVHNSLLLIRPENFSVEIGWNYRREQKSFRGVFKYRGTPHNLSVTDPVARDVFGLKQEGRYPLRDVYLCVSLTDAYEYDGKCYKLVAGIISRQPIR